MKKIMMVVGFAAICLLPMHGWGHGFGAASLCDAEWTPVQIGIWPFVVFSNTTDIYGVNLTDLLHTKQVMYMAYLPRRLTYVMTIMVSVSLLHRI